MSPLTFALRRPITVMVALAGLIVGSGLALWRMKIDIFPNLNLPVVYVVQPYGGMDPAQMEALLTFHYENHFLYISGIHHIESRNIQGFSQMKIFFHPGTDMVQAMAEVVAQVNRARSFMPPGTVAPFVVRFDAGSAPVGYLVLESKTKTIDEIQEAAYIRVRPTLVSLQGVSAPPPFGGNQRTIVLHVDPDRLRAYSLSPDDVVSALTAGNSISPSGNSRIQGFLQIVPTNAMVVDPQDLGNIPLRPGRNVYIRDVVAPAGGIEDGTDIPTSFALVNGRRAVYMLVSKRADASTLAVVNRVKEAMPKMQAMLPEEIKLRFEFDQSPYVTRAMAGVASEGALGAILTGLMVLLFLRDWRSVIVVVLNIPFALLGARRCLVAHRADAQPHDARRAGPGRRHSRRRGHGRRRKHSHAFGQVGQPGPGRLAWHVGDDGAAAAGHAVRPGRLPSGRVHGGGGPRAVRAAVVGRRFLDGRQLPAVEHVRARAVRLAAEASRPPRPLRSRPGASRSSGSRPVTAICCVKE